MVLHVHKRQDHDHIHAGHRRRPRWVQRGSYHSTWF
jgi:hypothetical protein